LLKWTLKRPTEATLKLRHPRWSKEATVLVNGREVARSRHPGSFVELRRAWENGDQVELVLAMHLAIDRAPAAPDIVAFTYGPLVLAGALGREDLQEGADVIVNERLYGAYNDGPFTPPQLAGDPEDILDRIAPARSRCTSPCRHRRARRSALCPISGSPTSAMRPTGRRQPHDLTLARTGHSAGTAMSCRAMRREP
jgi:DUF1680 family protein